MTTADVTSRPLDRGIGLDAVVSGTHPILERLYFAARNDAWGNILLVTRPPVAEAPSDGTLLRFESVAEDPATPLSVVAEVTTRPDGLTAAFRATAHEEFRYNRIGWCLLHPASTSVGAAVRAEGPDAVSELVLPADIVPQPMVDGQPRSFLPPFRSLAFERDGIAARFELEGDLFEIEDQRNWSDASFKTYSTPLALGGGHRAHAGMVIEQRVTLTVERLAGVEEVEPEEIVVGDEIGRLPVVRLGGATPSAGMLRPANGFVEFNRDRPEAASGLVLGFNGSVHMADDSAVMSTASMHGVMIRQSRAVIGADAPLVIDPLDFDDRAGEWRTPLGALPAPQHPSTDPRRRSAFGAAWIVASLSAAAVAGATELGYFDATVSNAPAAALIRELAALEGAPVRAVAVPRGLAGLSIGGRVWVANLAADARSIGAATIAPYAVEELAH